MFSVKRCLLIIARMEDHIFFKDKNNELKGPFTERQVQEWYRQKWFDSSFPFYFAQGNERPSDVEYSGVTLEELCSYNGIGCPFRRIDESMKNEELRRREEGRKRLEKIEKEIADLKPKCAGILAVKKSLEQVEKKLEGLTVSMNKNTPNPVEKAPKVEPVKKKEQNYEEFGNALAKYVLDAFAVYGTGNFANFDITKYSALLDKVDDFRTHGEKVARNAVCERILIEKMKEKEFFYCVLCDAVQFNYKQALVHFSGKHHHDKEQQANSRGELPAIGFILNALTPLCDILWKDDSSFEMERHKKHSTSTGALRPEDRFGFDLSVKYVHPLSIGSAGNTSIVSETADIMANLKSGVAQRIYSELHEHIGRAKTWCSLCGMKTGDREGFYAHLVSSLHLLMLAKGGIRGINPIRYDPITMAVNVHRKDLV